MRFSPQILLSFLFVVAGGVIVSAAPSDETDQRAADLEEQIETVADRDRAPLLNELAKLVRRQDPERTIELATEALALATRYDDLQGMADAHRYMGLGYLMLGRYAGVVAEMQEAETLFRRLGDKKEVAKCLGYQGMGLSSLGRLWSAIDTVERALEAFRELDDEKGIAASTNNLGVCYEAVGEHELALRYNLEALEVERKLGRKLGIANNLNSIGNIHFTLEDQELARDYYQQALEIFEELGAQDSVAHCLNNLGNCSEKLGRNDEALEYFGRSIEIARRMERPMLETNPLNNMGIVYKKQKDYDRALASYRKVAEIRERFGETGRLASTLLNIGEVYLLMGRLPEALDHLHRAEAIADDEGGKRTIEGINLNLAEAYHEQGDHVVAYDHLQRYIEARDVRLNEEKNRAVAELQARYDADRQRENIELLTKDAEIRALQLSRARLTAGLMVALAILVIGAAALLLRRYRSLLAFWKKKVFIGPYRVGEEISTGGMGVVYRATNVLEPGRTIALKVIRDELAGDATQRQRFVNEGQIIDSINHPNIVTVFDRGEHNQRLYIAMEYLAGRTLAEIIRDTADRGEMLSEQRCLQFMGQLADAVTSIHAMGIVHRDIKPNNVVATGFQGAEEQVKLLDFGTAKLDTMTTLTAAGELVGTVSYLAPERIRHSEPTAASDVFSLGVVFYELLTLEKPFPAEDAVVLIRELLESDPVEPASFRPGLNGGLNAFVLAMLEKDPHRRPAGEELMHRMRTLAAEVA
jgi:tetratricopeptide (TPR) repeat protein